MLKMSEVPLDLILEVKAQTRAAAGLTVYNPGDPRLPSLPSLSATIAVSDPSPLHTRCKNCKGRLLRGVESTICLYCGSRPDHESVPDPICFSSTAGHQWLLHALHLKGTEMVERTTKPEKDEDQNVRKSYTSISDLLNIRMPRPTTRLVQDLRSSENRLVENESHWSLNGVAPGKFFIRSNITELSGTATAEVGIDDFGTSDRKLVSKLNGQNLFQNVRSNTTEGSSTQKTSVAFEEWKANFQPANSESNHGNETPSDHTSITSDGIEDKFHKSVTLDGSRNLDVDLSLHIDSVFGYREDANDGKVKHSATVSTEFGCNSDDLQNMRPNVSNVDGDFDPFITINNGNKADRTLDNLKHISSSAGLFPVADDLNNLSSNVYNADDGFDAFITVRHDERDDQTLDNFKDFSSSVDLFPVQEDFKTLDSNVSSGDDAFDAFLSAKHDKRDDGSEDVNNISSNALNIDDDFDNFLSAEQPHRDDQTSGNLNVSSSADLFPGSDDWQNMNVMNGDDGFDAFLHAKKDQSDGQIVDNINDFSSSADFFSGSDDLQNVSSNVLNVDDGFDSFISAKFEKKDDQTPTKLKMLSSNGDLQSFSSNKLNDDDAFDAFVTAKHDQELDNFQEFSSSADMFPGSDELQNHTSNVPNGDDKYDAFLSAKYDQRNDHFKDFSSSDNLFTGSDDLQNLRPPSVGNSETFDGSRNIDIDLDPLSDSGIGKDVNHGNLSNHSAIPTAFDDLNIDEMWKNLSPNISKISVSFDDDSKKDDPSGGHFFPYETDVTGMNNDSKSHQHDEAVDEDLFDEWSGFVGSNSLEDPRKNASTENKQLNDLSSENLPRVELGDELFPSEQVIRSKSLDANLGQHIDSVFGLWEDVNVKNGNNSSSNWSSDDMWMNMNPNMTNFTVDFDPFISKKDIKDHTPDNSKDFYHSSPDLLQPFEYQQTEMSSNLNMHQPGHDVSVDDDPVDEWNDFMGSNTSQDPPKHRLDHHFPSNTFEFRDKFDDSQPFAGSVSELPKDVNDQRTNSNVPADSPAFSDWNSDEMWKNMNTNVPNIDAPFDALFSTKNDPSDDHTTTLYNLKDIFSGADSIQSQSTIMTNYNTQLHRKDDENDEWNDFIGPTS